MKKTFSLVASLTAVSAACAAVLACVNALTAGPVAEARKHNALEAARAVMPAAVVRVEPAKDGAFLGYAADGSFAGCAVPGSDSGGYGGDIVLMVGFGPDRRTVVRYRKLAASETPGLGMKLSSPEFADQFAGRDGTDLKVKKDGGSIEAIASATITSRAVCRAVADAAKRAASL